MTVQDLITLIASGALGLVFVATTIDLVRWRDRVRLDIQLMFASLVGVVLLGHFARTAPAGSWLRDAGPLLLLAHPYLLVRLVRHFHRVPRMLYRFMLGFLLVAWFAILIGPLKPMPPLVLPVLGAYFTFGEIYAAIAFALGARMTGGVTRRRLALAAVGSAMMGALIFGIRVFALVPNRPGWVAPVLQLFGLVGLVSYYVGFAPPRRLRRYWQLSELHEFFRDLMQRSAEERSRLALDDLCAAANRVVGSQAAAVAGWDERVQALRIVASGEASWVSELLPADEGLLGTAWTRRTPLAGPGGVRFSQAEARLAERVGATTALAVPLITGERVRGVLGAFLRHRPLFPADDLQLLSLLAGQAALALEKAELLAREEALVESAPDAIVIVSQAGRILRINAAAEKLFGFERQELIGKLVDMLLPERVRERHVVERTQYTVDAVTRPMGSGRELFALRNDGSEFPAEISLSPIGRGTEMMVMTIIRDTSARKAAEREMQQRNRQLESLNRELAAFSYSISHDLRTPLRAIDGYSHIVLQEFSAQLPEEALRYLKLVRRSATRMDQLIYGLLETARLGRQALKLRPVDLKEVVAEALEELMSQEPGHIAEVCVGDLPVCQADPVLLRQVMVNLLENALKFTRKTARRRIEVGTLPREDGYICCFVKDNGVGFDMQHAGKLFGVFQRLHLMDEFEGSGVGLAIVKSVIERHGGKVWAESEVDQGATFYFTLPENA